MQEGCALRKVLRIHYTESFYIHSAVEGTHAVWFDF